MTKLRIDEIRTDGGTQPRAQLKGHVVAEYAEDMERGVDFPPISVMYDGEEYWLYDGFHRLRAAEKVGRSEIEADVEQGTKEDAQWASLAANKRHGLRRSKSDVRRAVKRAIDQRGDQCSTYEIAEHVGVSQSTVWRRKKELEDDPTNSVNQSDKTTGRDGRTIDTSNIGGSGGTSSSTSSQPDNTQYDPDTRGDGAPRSRSAPSGGLGASGEHTAGKSTEEYVDAHEAVRRVCVQLSSITEDGSRLDAGIQELVQRAQQDELPAREIDKLRSELESVAKWFLDHAFNLHPDPGTDKLYNYD